jgi:DNA-binding response OmpR family regulator
MKRILLIEDEAAVAKGLIYGLKEEGFHVSWAATGEEGLSLLYAELPDLLLLDIRLPGMDGYEICRSLRGQGHRLPILMLTARDDVVDKVLGFELGADDYLIKPFSFRELVSRINALLRRSYGELSRTGAKTAIVGELRIDLEHFRVTRRNQPIFLTPTEFKLLRYLLANPNRPMSRQRLIEGVWGYDEYSGDERTVDVHVRHLRAKLEPDPSKPCLIVTVRGFGYKLALP